MIIDFQASSSVSCLPTRLMTSITLSKSSFVGNTDIQVHSRPLTGVVAGDGYLAVGDIMNNPVQVPDDSSSYSHFLHQLTFTGDVHHVALPILIIYDDNHSSENILNQALPCQTHSKPGYPNPRQQRPNAYAHLGDYGYRGYYQNCRRTGGISHSCECLPSLLLFLIQLWSELTSNYSPSHSPREQA